LPVLSKTGYAQHVHNAYTTREYTKLVGIVNLLGVGGVFNDSFEPNMPDTAQHTKDYKLQKAVVGSVFQNLSQTILV